MSYSAKQYFAHHERLLEPTAIIITGTHRRWHEVRRNRVLVNPSPDNRTEAEVREQEDVWLAEHGVPVTAKTN